MGVLDGKAAIVTGSARGIGRATAELLAEHGAKVLINDLDGDVAEEASNEIAGETVSFAGDLTKEGVTDKLVQTAVDVLRPARHRGQQRRLHLGRPDPQDVRRAVPGHARHPQRGAVQGAARRGAAPARARQEGARGGPRGVPQGGQRLLGLGHDGQRRPGQLLLRQVRRGGPDQDRGQGVGPVQDQRERRGVRVRGDAPDRRQGGGRARSTRTARRSSSASPSRCARWRRC